MMTSLFSGVSGLKNHQTRMNIVGNNISNINTIGFKLSRVTFQEALVQTMRGAGRPSSTSGGTNPLQLGLGMDVASIDNLFTQGGLESTGQVTDLAIQGSGFFMISDGQANYYTRAGAFGLDGNGNLVQSSTGYILQGKMAETDGTILVSTPVGNLSIPFGQQDPPNVTSEIQLKNNLDSNATDSEASLVSAGTTNVTSVSGTATDGVGGTHLITINGVNATNSIGSGTHANELANATAPTMIENSGTGLFQQPAGNYYYYVTATNDLGETLGVESVAAVTTDALTDFVRVSWAAVAGATGYKIYRTDTPGDYSLPPNGLCGTVGAVTQFDDYGNDGTADIPTANSTVNLVGDEQLSALGVTDTAGFRLRVDGGTWINFSELTVNSTINDLIQTINSKATGVTASIESGQIQIKRNYAGGGSSYYVELEDSGAGNVTSQVFNDGGAATFTVNNGTASTLTANDVFTPTGRTALDPLALTLTKDSTTGLVTGIENIGGGGINIVTGSSGLAAGILEIAAEDTQHATSITVYDSQGGKHTVTITFTKSVEENTWYWEAATSGNEIITGGNTGQVVFNSDGSLASFTYDGGASELRINPNNGADPMEITFDAGSPNSNDGLTGFANTMTASATGQDGYASGILENIAIGSDGIITGIFSNGVSRTMGQIYLADFNNAGGLLKIGSSLFNESANSGTAVAGIAGETISGSITSGALEMSNVDLAQEFTSMIVAQRGFQANAKIITTSDSMLAELVNLKRA
jgi:flagellar hook protein FlgE